jgi:hypothetical protein
MRAPAAVLLRHQSSLRIVPHACSLLLSALHLGNLQPSVLQRPLAILFRRLSELMSDANGGRDTGPSGLKTKIDVAPYSILPRAPLFVITAKETKLEPSPSEYQAAKRVRVDTT